MQKVFLSWCGADRDFKNQVFAKLDSVLGKNVEIWESDEHCISNFSKECIKNIRESQVFVLLLSKFAQSSTSYVLNEVIEAHRLEGEGKLNIVVFNIDSCELTDEFAMQINHISDANHVKQLRKDGDNIDVLVDRVKTLLRRRAEGNPEKPLSVFEPKLVGLPIMNNNYYVSNSRDKVLDELHIAFENNNVVFVNEISGYGRKSVAKIYATQHFAEYDYALEIHTACNSLRDFLLKGIEFENISDEIYAKLDENHIVLKDIELLKQLTQSCGKRVLLLVPFVKIDKEDFDDFVLSCLKALPIKVMFVTENVPKAMADKFPTIYIGRMENKYLQELFFHYTDIDDDDRQAILPSVHAFFDSIGGHTAAVELAAKTIADEFGLTADDIVDALDKIKPNTDNDLSERIYFAYANLFSLKQFSQKQLEILSLLSLLVDTPASEKLIVDMLKSCGIFDSSALKSLCDLGWIKRDIQAKTLNIEPIISKVCLANCVIDDEKIAQCLNFVTSKLASKLDLAGDLVFALAYATKLYRYKNAEMYAQICYKLFAFVTSMELKKSSLDGLDELLDNAEEDDFKLGELFGNANAIVLSFGWTYSCVTDDDYDKDKISRSEFIDNLLNVTAEVFEGDFDILQNHGKLGRMYVEMLSMRDSITMDKIMDMVNTLVENRQELLDESRMDDVAADIDDSPVSLMVQVCNALNLILNQYIVKLPLGTVKLKMCQTWIKFVDTYADVLGKTIVFNVHEIFVSVMDQMGCESNDIEKELSFGFNMINKYKAYLFTNESAYRAELTMLNFIKTNNLLAMSKLDEAVQIFTVCMEDPWIINTEMAEYAISCVENLIEELGKTQDKQQVVNLIKDVFTPSFINRLVLLGNDAKEVLDNANEYLNLIKIDDKQLQDKNYFIEEKHLDYYSQYGLETCDKRTYKTYEGICNAVASFDFSDMDQHAILKKVNELKHRASVCKDWKEIAAEAFALVSEAGYRILGYRHHWVQYFGACCMLDDNIAQILNGEGKTYTILLVAFTQYLFGYRVDIFDTLEHLCRRNYNWVGGVLKFLGLKVGLLVSTLSGKDAEQLSKCDVIYAVLSSFLFTLCGLDSPFYDIKLIGDVAIVDEADDVMIENGTQIYHVVGQNTTLQNIYMPQAVCMAMNEISHNTENYFTINTRGQSKIKDTLYELIRSIHAEMQDKDPNWERDLYVAIKLAIHVFYQLELNKDYFIVNGTIKIEDTKTGILNDVNNGLQGYFIARKENLFNEEKTYNSFLIQNNVINYYTAVELFSKYKHVCGTTATAISMKDEFKKVYGKNVVCVPPNKPIIRIDHPFEFYTSKVAKMNAAINMISKMHATGRPILVLTASMYEAEEYSQMLHQMGIEHTVLNANNANDEERILSNCGRLNAVTVATAIANRGVDIALGGSAAFITKDALRQLGFSDEKIAIALSGDTSPLSKSIAVCYVKKLEETIKEVQANREQVQELGGLAVICTSCFEDLRLEQQARGRCGRQGQQGESWVLMSMEDDILKSLYGAKLSMFTGITDDLSTSVLNKAIANVRHKLQSKCNYNRFEDVCSNYTNMFREKFIGLSHELYNGQAYYMDVCNNYVCENAGLIRRWQNEELLDYEERLIEALYGDYCEAPLKRKEAEIVLKNAVAENVLTHLPQEISKNQFFALIVNKQWCPFFNEVWEQYKVLKVTYKDKPTAFKKKMQEFADKCCEEKMIQAITIFVAAKLNRKNS